MSLSVPVKKGNVLHWSSPHAVSSVANVMQMPGYKRDQMTLSDAAADYSAYEEEEEEEEEDGIQKKKRKRGENWTNEDELLLVQLCQKHRIRLESEDVTLRAKNESWQKLTNEFNAVAKWGARDTKALKGKFKAMKASAKKNAHKMNSTSTGDGRALRLSVAERQLVQLYSDSPGFSRIAGGIDLAAIATASTGSFDNTQTCAESVDTDDAELMFEPAVQMPADCSTSSSSASKHPAKMNATLPSKLPHNAQMNTSQTTARSLPGFTEVTQAVASISESQQLNPSVLSSSGTVAATPAPEQCSIAQLQHQIMLKQWQLLRKQDTLLAKQLKVTNLQLQYMSRK